jgi:hypothetical protein
VEGLFRLIKAGLGSFRIRKSGKWGSDLYFGSSSKGGSGLSEKKGSGFLRLGLIKAGLGRL